jgi:hypothetical protein
MRLEWRDFIFGGLWLFAVVTPLYLMGATLEQLRMVLPLAVLATLPSTLFTLWWVDRRRDRDAARSRGSGTQA